MDRSLDEIVAESQQHKRGGNRSRRGGARPPRERDSFPRDGVRKSTRDDSRGVDADWVHDRFEDYHSRERPRNNRRRERSPEIAQDVRGTKLKVDNLHYDLSKEDLDGLFSKIGRVLKLELLYDRAGRSEGVAYVTYERRDHATKAIHEFNGANAKGQPIRLNIVSSAPPRRNPFDTAYMPGSGGSLADRISRPDSRSPNGRNIDRYVPDGSRDRRRSRSPIRRRGGRGAGGGGGGGGDGGRRPGARRERGAEGGGDGRPRGRDGRPKKTQEELDAEMADYFGPGGDAAGGPAETTAGVQETPAGDDVDMIE
ncbi:hypothetical protein GGR56DRAFT_327520 [Xylariaceae sp. FL0804]|nr:hypothetical protein GGR56DRAFT_327520 [Xylariaceae sp. FL0804]